MFVQATSLGVILIIPVLLAAFLLGALTSYASLAILAGAAVVTVINSHILSKYKAEIREIKEELVRPLSILKAAEYQSPFPFVEHSIFTTQPILSETIRNSFFSHKVSNNPSAVKDDVAAEYQKLVRL